MSWSLSLTDVDRTDVRDVATKAYQDYRTRVEPTAEPDTLAAMDEQFDAALEAIEALLGKGAVGTEGLLHLTLSGHANPGHTPRPGWANDTVMVSVSRASG